MKLLIAFSIALLTMTVAFAADPDAGSDATSASVAALKANLGNTKGLEIDEVRVTAAGVACIDYHFGNGEGAKSRGHAVVQGKEVLKSSADPARFEKAWNEHCLGPRGGISANE